MDPVAEVKTEVAPVVVSNQPEVKEVKEDLITRVSKEAPRVETNTFGLTKEDWDKVQTDPTLKKYYDSMHTDYQKKTQTLAEQRKEIEKTIAENKTWTPEKVSGLLKDDNFVKAASQVVQSQAPKGWTGTDERWSNLSESEKKEFTDMQNRMSQLEQQNYLNAKVQQDSQLKTKYANYASDIVDTTINKLVKMEQMATREDVWKVIDYENAVKRAYELGIKDGKQETGQVSSLPSGVQTQSQSPAVEPIKGESDRAYFKRIAEKNLANAISQRK